MSKQGLQGVVHQLNDWMRQLYPATDAELLQAYVATREEGAFAELVRRHGPLVWGICRQLLARTQDAEDAFQATFLVLARRAAAVRKRESLACWLSSVARRTARAARRAAHVTPGPERVLREVADPARQAASAELCEVILAEVQLLPEKYRLPLVLCGLEGLTRTEAARRLGWPEGTVAGRLDRARSKLHESLVRRGVLPSLAALPALTTAVPKPLQAAAVQHALLFAAGKPSTSGALPLAQEVLRSMHATPWKLLTAVVAVALIALAGVGRSSSEKPPEKPPEKPRPPIAPAVALPEGKPSWQERLRLRGYSGHAWRHFSPDGRLLVTVNASNRLQFLDTTTWKERSHRQLAKDPKGTYYPQFNPFSPDGRLFVLYWKLPVKGKKDGHRWEISLIEVATGKELVALEGRYPQFSPAGTLLAFSRGDDLILWDYASRKEVRRRPAGAPLKWQGDWFSPDGKYLFGPTTSGRGKLWKVAGGKELSTLEGFLPVWSRDGKTLATSLPGGVVKLWDAATGRERATLRGFDWPHASGQFSPDGRLFLSNVSEMALKPDGEFDWPRGPRPGPFPSKPLDLRLWDAVTGKEVARLPGKLTFSRSGIFSPDGKWVAYLRLAGASGYDMEAVLWDVAAGKEHRTIREEHGIDGLQFTPDSKALVGFADSGGGDQATMIFWDVRTGKELAFIPGASRSSQDPHFSPDGKTIALAVTLPVVDPPPGGVPTPFEIRIYQWTARPVTREIRGKPVKIEPSKPKEEKPPTEAAPAIQPLKKEKVEAKPGEPPRPPVRPAGPGGRPDGPGDRGQGSRGEAGAETPRQG
jgi:RNA polymerase sigma factor (sigma-70 family)